MLCSLAGNDHYFELSKVYWERPDEPGYTLAKGLNRSHEAAQLKSTLIAQGKTNEANTIATAGLFEYPLLQSFTQSLERKLKKSYALHNRPCSLLLYYADQNPAESYDLLFECRDALAKLLTGSVFDTVWLYDHRNAYSISLGAGGPGFAAMAGIVGRIALREGRLSMSFDARYSMIFNEASDQLASAW